MASKFILFALLAMPVYLFPQNVDTNHVLAKLENVRLLINNNQFDEALAETEKSLSILDKSVGPTHPLVGMAHYLFGLAKHNQGALQEANEAYERALAIQEKSLSKNDINLAETYARYGLVQARLGQMDAAPELIEKALNIYLHEHGEEHPRVADFHSYLGTVLFYLGKYAEAEGHFRSSLEVRLQLFEGDHADIAAGYANLGAIQYEQSDLDGALYNLLRARDMRLRLFGEGHPSLASTYNNLGNIFDEMSEWDAAIEHYQKALDIRLPIFGENHPEVANQYNNIGTVYESKGDHGNALKNHFKAVGIRRQVFGEVSEDVAQSYHNLGNTFFKNGQPDEAQSYFEKALSIRREVLGEGHLLVGQTCNSIGEMLLEMGRPVEALPYLQTSKDIKVRNLTEAHPNVAFAYELLGDAEAALGKRKKARAFYGQSLQSLEMMRQRFSTVTEETYFNRNYSLFESAIRNEKALGGAEALEGAFLFSEKSKGLALMEALRTSKAKKFAGLPSDLLLREDSLQVAIAEQEQQALSVDETSDTTGAWAKLRESKAAITALMKEMETSYPEYHRLKYDTKTVGTATIRAMLIDQQAMLQFSVGDSSIFVFKIGKGQPELLEIPLDFPLGDWVDEMRKSIYGHFTTPTSNENKAGSNGLIPRSHSLYLKLIAPLGALPQHLIIVPDGALGYIPFEILMKQKPSDPSDFSTYKWLGMEHTISYNYSATLWQEMKNKKAKGKGLVTFAPSFYDDNPLAGMSTSDYRRNNLGPLVWNDDEAVEIIKIAGGEALIGGDATTVAFNYLAQRSAIIHLATHAKLDDRNSDFSYLAFSGVNDTSNAGKIYIRDLYNMQLPLDMVVLSACETGIGELQRGEGIISLARGFTYAGAKSIVTSLWEVNDKATKIIMTNFYKYLKEGNDKAMALQKAKMDYLNDENIDPKNKHPFYWASFIAVGDMSPVDFGGGLGWWWLFFGGALVLLLAFFFMKKE